MGAACCVAGKGKTVTNVSPGDNLPRHAHYSPTWSFRWDNRGRVAGEETHSNWARDERCADNSIGVKFGATVEAAFASEEGSPLDGFRSSHTWRKPPLSDGNSGTLRLQPSDQAIPQNIPEIKESTDSPSAAYSPPLKLPFSPSVPSLSSKSASPLSSQSHHPHFFPNPTPSTWHHRSPRHPLFRQVSGIKIPKSPSFSISEDQSSLQAAPSWGNVSTRGSQGGSSDGWSIPTLSDLVPVRRQSWSFDSDRFTKLSGPHSSSPSLDLQTCGICTQLLTDRSSLGTGGHKLMYSNELAVVSVLTCGHVYHSECLEYMTPDVDKYDPPCPVCTFGEKRAAKMSEKALRIETDVKARKRSRKRVVDSDLSGEIVFDRSNSGGPDRRALKLGSGSTRKAFLRRHFTFGAKMSSQFTDRQSNPRRGFFWARSSRE